ncbi:MAG: radical SAM protein [Candidatus Riflebacteria bacterium]|nr:radical SAM protein [Candidatus Riflebacteria bacterium]
MNSKLPRVVVIGHIVPTPYSVIPTAMERWGYNYNRVLLEDGSMVDHLAYLKKHLGIPREIDFTVWEMYLSGGLALKSHLKRAGVDVKLVNHIDENNEGRIFEDIRSFAPDIVCLGTTFLLSPAQLNYAARLVRKHLPEVFMVAGGHHVYTALLRMNESQQRAYLKATPLNAFVNDSQGEDTLLRFIQAFRGKPDEIPNLIMKRPGGEIIVTERLMEHNDLNVPIDLCDIPEGSVIHLRTGRGCSFRCAFCSYPSTAGNREIMEIENVIGMLGKAKDAGVRSVIFSDDTFNVPQERFELLLDKMIETGFTLPWYSFLRCQFVDAPLVDKMRRSGCRGVFLGIESAADAILENIGKNATVKHFRQGIKWLKDAGIATVGSFVIGFPGETQETLDLTEDFIQNSGLDYYFMQLFYYLHHTPVHHHAEKYSLKGNGLLWSHSTMDWKEASARMNQIFLHSKTLAVHQDYNLWEIALLESKGFDRAQIADYRGMINRMTAEQMSIPIFGFI